MGKEILLDSLRHTATSMTRVLIFSLFSVQFCFIGVGREKGVAGTEGGCKEMGNEWDRDAGCERQIE